MEPSVQFITLGVPDLATARAFYTDGLGWPPLLDVPGEITFFQVGPGLVLSVFDREALEDDAPAVELSRHQTPPLSLSQNVGSDLEVELRYERALEAGATSVKAPRRAAFGGYHAYVTDPAGFLWEICHNPGWRVAPDGTVSLTALADE